MKFPSLFLRIYLMEVYFVCNQYSHSHFLVLTVTCYIFFNPSTVNLFVPIYLKSISYRQHITGFCFLIQPDNHIF